ncbi:uncharacterized protein EV154DRAFT_518638 [Mucor mucedo]|uniref:uncharacterized protein n=1 Tax=Mucor mucedo TaxID=29922 RepID=UPI00221E76F3|nr:uncharacterized protein EV154DRAFT_518638 [Mucor mucedo]KAI7888087.1 hypothetical protein EV154DRAFT_518638 [Mucor mucedo]
MKERVEPRSMHDEFIRHGLSDLSMSRQHPISPLEPKDYRRRASVTDLQHFHSRRRPSLNPLPLPNHSHRAAGTMTEFQFPAAPTGAATANPYTFPPKPASLSPKRRDSFTHQPPEKEHAIVHAPPAYDPYQRRHSIATADHPYQRHSAKYRDVGFRFPATIQETPHYNNSSTYSAPPSPPQSGLYPTGEVHRSHVSRMEPYLGRRASMPNTAHKSSRRGSVLMLMSDEEDARKESPYSRSPELRVSHKLAERKRRKEMKDLFDELRDSLPVEKNMKTSKWEILSKAVEYISLLKRRDFDLENQVSGLRRELDMMKRR